MNQHIAIRILTIVLATGGQTLFGADRPIVTYREREGRVFFQAEEFSSIDGPQDWTKVTVAETVAMKVLDTGKWARSLRYDIVFTQPGTYRLWLNGRKNPTAAQYQGNDIKVFFFRDDQEAVIAPGHYIFEIGLREQKEFRWLDWVKGERPKEADIEVPRPGTYSLYLVGGAGEEWGFEVDAICLIKDNQLTPEQVVASGEAFTSNGKKSGRAQ